MPLPTFFNLPEEKRSALVEVALDEFAEHDYDSASISQIVARAGISKGSLYQYFEDKRDLYRYLLDRVAQEKASVLADATPPQPDMPVFDTLRWLFQAMMRFEVRHPRLAKIGYRAAYGKSPLPDDLTASARQASLQHFTALIERGRQRGEIRPEVDPSVAAFIFMAALTELGNHLRTAGPAAAASLGEDERLAQRLPEVQKLYDQIITILQYGAAAQPPAAR